MLHLGCSKVRIPQNDCFSHDSIEPWVLDYRIWMNLALWFTHLDNYFRACPKTVTKKEVFKNNFSDHSQNRRKNIYCWIPWSTALTSQHTWKYISFSRCVIAKAQCIKISKASHRPSHVCALTFLMLYNYDNTWTPFKSWRFGISFSTVVNFSRALWRPRPFNSSLHQ